MKLRAATVPAALAAILLLLAAAPPLLADGDGSATGLPEVLTPALGPEPPPVGQPPFRLLSPFRDLLSGSMWVMASGQDPRPDLWLGGRARRSGAAPPGLAWGSIGEVLVAPPAPASAPPSQGAGLVPFRDPAPSFSRNILISRDFSSAPLQTEPNIAVSPLDPEQLLVGTIDYNFPNVSSYVSIDAGATWEGPFQPQFLRDDVGSGGDPVAGFDRQGNAYLAYISIGVEEYTVGPAADIAVVSSIAVARSQDGGRAWGEPVSSARSSVARNLSTDAQGRVTGQVSVAFLDKPWMRIGPSPKDPSMDVVYVTYTEFTERFSIFYIGDLPFFGVPVLETAIKAVRSEDGGRTWSEPVAVSPAVRRIFGAVSTGEEGATSPTQPPSGHALGTRRVVQGSQPVVAPDGALFVAWLDSTDDDSMEGLAEIYVASSRNGGATFSQPVLAATFNEPAFTPRKSFFRYWGSAFPQIAAGPQGQLYIVYVAPPPGTKTDDGDVFFVRSLDGGKTWGRPKRLNGDDGDALQFFPAIAVDPAGNLHAMWGDMRNDRAQTRYHVYYTRSEDQGATWGFLDPDLGIRSADARVTDFPSNPSKGFPGGRFIGDYFSMAATSNDVYMVWPDTRLGEFGPVNQKIGFARRTAIRSPEVFLSPPAGPGGQPVTLQGFNFQPNVNVFLMVGGVVVATERTGGEGRFTTQLFIPISGEGAHSVDVFDDSGNRATSSFFMEFGFDNVQRGQQALEGRVGDLERGVRSLEGSIADTVRGEIARLEAALAPPTTAGPEPAPAPPPPSGGAPWWLVAAAAAASAALAAVAAALIARRGPRPPAGPGRWETVR